MRYLSQTQYALTYVTGVPNFAVGDTTQPPPPAVASIVRVGTFVGGSTLATAIKYTG